MNYRVSFVLTCLLLFLFSNPAPAQQWPSIDEATSGMQRESGPVVVYFDSAEEKILFEVQESDDPVLHAVTLSSGAAWPLDRGTFSFERLPALLRFRRVGGSVHVIEDTPGYLMSRASAGFDTVERSFPGSIVSTLPIVAASDGRWLVEATDFIVRDAFDVSGQLEWVGEVAALDRSRSNLEWPPPVTSDATTDLDVRLTFDVQGGSRWLEDRSPAGNTLSVVQRHIFFQITSPLEYRSSHEQMGFYAMPAREFGEQAEGGFRDAWIQRWRMEDENIGSAKPITFFIDGSVPSQYREAVREGVNYWQQVMELIGRPDAIRIADLPLKADPYDLQYQGVFLWMLHRQPMASMANVVVDPRSGEIVKSIIHLEAHGPLVARNEYRSYRAALVDGAPTEDEYVHAYLVWTVAHELAHVVVDLDHMGYGDTAVGFARPQFTIHGDRCSIDLRPLMPDTPYPYDVWSAEYAYADGGAENLAKIGKDGLDAGLRAVDYETGILMPEAVARVKGDAFGAFRIALEVRSLLMTHFGSASLDEGEPEIRLYERLAPVYFHHINELQAIARTMGGVRFANESGEIESLPAGDQKRALELIFDALQPEDLAIPPRVIQLMPAGPPPDAPIDLMGEPEEPGVFRFQTGNTAPIDIRSRPGHPFDAVAWAEALADRTASSLLSSARVASLTVQTLADPSLPSLDYVVSRVLERTWYTPLDESPSERPYQIMLRRVVLTRLLALVESEDQRISGVVILHLGHLLGSLDSQIFDAVDERAAALNAIEMLTAVSGIQVLK